MYYRINSKGRTESTYANVQTGQVAGLFDAVNVVPVLVRSEYDSDLKGGVYCCCIVAARCGQISNLQPKGRNECVYE
ncbi:unknown protein [Paenibacillus amylolyticus]|uniref:Uncharacterized protein n=1 Tax=Paenibacillus amylolyticus TaxID=1451 RepID=A0A124DX61_PAEAM|nr:unknown protein [Paenibacillus amylolyticus]